MNANTGKFGVSLNKALAIEAARDRDAAFMALCNPDIDTLPRPVRRRLLALSRGPSGKGICTLEPRSASERLTRRMQKKNVFQLVMIAERAPRKARNIRKKALKKFMQPTYLSVAFAIATALDLSAQAAIIEFKARTSYTPVNS